MTARTRGQPKEPDSQIGCHRRPLAALPGRRWHPFSRPRLQPSDFFPIQVTFKNQPNFGPSKNQPQEASQSTLGRPWTDLGLILYAFGVHFRGRFWSYFEAFSKKLKTLIFDDLTALSKVFHIQKPLIFRPFFGSFLVPISGPPSGRSFSPILADQGADLASSGRFWAHFGDPGFSKKAPWATPSRPETSKKGGTPSCSFHPVAVLEANSAPKGHQRPSVSIWDRFWSHLGLILHHGEFISNRF